MIKIVVFIAAFAFAADLSEQGVRAGGWSEYEGDVNSKWKEALSIGVISVDGVSAEDLTQFGEPVKATSQVVAGTNYKFEFADATEINVLEQLWMDPKMQITRIESPTAKSFPVEICENSPQQLCRMLCSKQQFCPDQNQCAMRKGPCCNFTCVDQSEVVKTALSKEGETCEGWDETSAKPFPTCEEGLVCNDAGKISIPGAGKVCMQELGSSCSLEDGSTVPSGWKGPGIGDNYCNRCWCNDGAFMCTLKGCLPRGATLDVFAPPELTTWSLKGAWDMSLVQKYLEEFTEIFADTVRVDKSAVQSVVIRPMGTETEMKVSAFLTPFQKKYVNSPAFESLLRENIKSTADDLAKGMGYDIRSGSFILQGPWDVNVVEASSFELQRQFALALGIPQNLVDVEITEDDFLTKIDFTAKSEGSKLMPLNNPQLFQQTLEKQIKQTNPALATVLALTDQPAAGPLPMQKLDSPSICPADMPDMKTPCTGSARCEYGQECCCGKCSASQVFQCDANAGIWITFYTDACFAPSCEGKLPGIATAKMDSPDTPDKPDKIDASEMQGFLDSPDTPDKHDSMDAPEMQGFMDSPDTPDKHDSINVPNMPGFVMDSPDTPDKHDSMDAPNMPVFKMDSPDTPDKHDQPMQFPDSPGLVLESVLESASSKSSSLLFIFVVFLGSLTFGFAVEKCLNRSKMQNKDVYTDLAANV